MELRLHPTDTVKRLEHNGDSFLGRVWRGTTDRGTPVEAWIPVVFPLLRGTDGPAFEAAVAEFDAALLPTGEGPSALEDA